LLGLLLAYSCQSCRSWKSYRACVCGQCW